MPVIKNCQRCGGEHWGSLTCPFTDEEIQRMQAPEPEVAPSDAGGGNQPPSGLRGDPGAPRTVNADGATETLANKTVGAPQEEP